MTSLEHFFQGVESEWKEERKEDRIFEKLRMAGGTFVGDGREDVGSTISLCSGKLRERMSVYCLDTARLVLQSSPRGLPGVEELYRSQVDWDGNSPNSEAPSGEPYCRVAEKQEAGGHRNSGTSVEKSVQEVGVTLCPEMPG